MNSTCSRSTATLRCPPSLARSSQSRSDGAVPTSISPRTETILVSARGESSISASGAGMHPTLPLGTRTMRVLLTNDDGIEADGLQALRRALLQVPDVELAVVAPDGNRSAMARSITTRRPLWVQRVDFGDGTHGYATDGTPVDCVRFARLGLIEGFEADMIVAGINHGANLGDDITYSGTVAAALEGVVLGLPAIA